MSKYFRLCVLAGLVGVASLAAGKTARAATVTLDMNGFPNLVNGQVTGGDLTEAIPVPGGKDKVVLAGLKPGMTYSVDLFHNGGEDGSDFTFTVNAADTGVESVTYINQKSKVLKDFKPGASTLTLDTHTIEFDPEAKQTAFYYIPGLCVTLPPDPGAQKFVAVPGIYNVDYLTNNAQGAEDFTFIVDGKGNVTPGPKSGEFIVCEGNKIKPRVTTVRFKIEATAPINYHATHKMAGEPKTENDVTTFDMPLPVGGGGVNVWNFGPCKVLESNTLGADGKPLEGFDSANDMIFAPRLRYDEKVGFYFETSKGGKATSVFSKVNGLTDGDASNLTVTVTATILEPLPKSEASKSDTKK